ncbi:MAG: DNA translocase FtsK [Bacteroidales bacterium]|jgi:S-DNA-T family DNA segregation ATPase FtsK/SpoIIIE|nr:DNA translocase FtsK [Bacteroidales bacterium]MCK9498437.1 DNA translocase FtsK [Bacteroidales bacterium]MDY0315097.1 DNA translocase FtsK 4TM domain-containing protein [Bacteroidales bacterium]NLB85894.1 DNA translocase FtsK [Bacteroidales bacterium]
MAKKKINKAKNTKDKKAKKSLINKDNQIIKFFKDEKFKISLGLFLLGFAILLCLSFTSYLFTWKADQSMLETGFKGLFSNSDFKVENWMGKIGALLSNYFIYNLFGLPSFSFVLIFGVFGLRLLNIKIANVWRFLFVSLIFTIWLSIALSTIFKDKFFMIGGSHGYFIYLWLNALVGKIGTYTILIISAVIITIYTFKNSLGWFKTKIDDISKLKPEDFVEGDFGDNDKQDIGDTEEKLDENNEQKALVIDFDNDDENLENEEKDQEEHELKPEEIIEEENGLSLGINEQTEEEALSDEEINSDFISDYDPIKELEYYKMPPIEILKDYSLKKSDVTRDELNANKNRIVTTLRDYKIEISRITATIGPTVTLYEIVPAPGVRISKIKNLEDDIALSLAALGIRIIAPIPGKGTIGIEVPNSKPEIVSMRSVIKSAKFQESSFELPVAIGKTISNETYVFNLAKTPHLLVAGATGQGKSVGINAVITSLLYKKHPSQLKFVLVDPKMVELSVYRRIEKHYLAKLPGEENPIITDVSKVVPAMNSLCIEMDNRYALLTQAGVRNIIEYNEKFISRRLNPLKGHYFMPYIVVVIDEFADIIVQEGKQVEAPISRLAAKARAIGIHLIVATQRPSTDVITGVIKANFPTRIAFKVTNGHDSKTILDTTGANQLIGRGDMLISNTGKITRVQCAFVDTPEVEVLVTHISDQQGYSSALELPEPEVAEGSAGADGLNQNEKDELFEEAARLIVRHQQGSTSLIQRRMSIGYNRAGRIIDQLEAAGIVGPYEGSKARQVFYQDEYSLEQYLNSLNEK